MTTTITAFDSARPVLIPPDPTAVFPYADGHYAWLHTEFPHALYKCITVLGDPDVDIADYEPGCIETKEALRTWAERRLGRGHTDLTVYTDRANYLDVASAMHGLDWHLFLSTLDGSRPASYAGKHCRAVQWTDRLGSYDISDVFDTDWMNKP